MKDDGRPIGIGFQELVSNHLHVAVFKRHGHERCRKRTDKTVQVNVKETSASKPFDEAS